MEENPTTPAPAARFSFERDAFAFPNELVWEYEFDSAGEAPPKIRRRNPPPTYAHHCFVLVRSARQFLYHANFSPSEPVLDEDAYRERILRVVSRNPRMRAAPSERIQFPGYSGLREFSRERERLLKDCCGGAWQSYVLRSHWRMVFPISRNHQRMTAGRLADKIKAGISPIVHLVRFPHLTINHGAILFDVAPEEGRLQFAAYDPNMPDRPGSITFDPKTSSFSMPPNAYWGGGRLDVIEIYHGWLY